MKKIICTSLVVMMGLLAVPIAEAEDPIPERLSVWFSTEDGFYSQYCGRMISDGDLLSESSCLVLTNRGLTQNLGIMPPAPDLGLDAVMIWPREEWTNRKPYIYFSLEETVWSETLGLLRHGDLLSQRGHIVRTEDELIHAFRPIVATVDGFGLDAVDNRRGQEERGFLFSTEEDFYSGHLGQWVRNGDLLAEAGFIYRTHAQLLRNFHPVDSHGNPIRPKFGLDAVHELADGSVLFSTEVGFRDARLGWVGEGDVLYEDGSIVRTNRDLLRICDPISWSTRPPNLDAITLVYPTFPVPAEPKPEE
jgi:hypothetical protein